MNDGLWYTVEGNGNSIIITVTAEDEDYDLELGVSSGSCAQLECEGSVDAQGSGDAEVFAIATSEIGITYYINIGHYSSVTDNPEGILNLSHATTIASVEV